MNWVQAGEKCFRGNEAISWRVAGRLRQTNARSQLEVTQKKISCFSVLTMFVQTSSSPIIGNVLQIVKYVRTFAAGEYI